MNREDERRIASAWLKWLGSQPMRHTDELTNETYMIFVQTYVRDNPRFRGLNVYEILDVMVNAELVCPVRGRAAAAA